MDEREILPEYGSYEWIGRENLEGHGAAVLCFGGINLGGGKGPKGEG